MVGMVPLCSVFGCGCDVSGAGAGPDGDDDACAGAGAGAGPEDDAAACAGAGPSIAVCSIAERLTFFFLVGLDGSGLSLSMFLIRLSK